MAKAIIKYDLSDSDDLREFKQNVASSAMASALFELIYNTEKRLEGELEKKENIDKYEVLNLVFERIHGIVMQHNINVDELNN
jgi:hypothetical protein